jgi:hypothetical protein
VELIGGVFSWLWWHVDDLIIYATCLVVFPLPLWMRLHERAKRRREKIEARPGFEVMPRQ